MNLTNREHLMKRLREEKDTTGAAAGVKDYLEKGTEEISSMHYSWAAAVAEGSQPVPGSPGEGLELCKARTALIDDLLDVLYEVYCEESACTDEVALVALGGYGRCELNIGSDIDLMLVHSDEVTPEVEKLAEGMLYVLWDTGLDMGFSLRTIDESMGLAEEDHKTMTALLDNRLIAGSPALYSLLEAAVRERLLTEDRTERFIREKLEENSTRHSRFGDSVYILEPNVKEGEGGLRDLHTARWVIKARHNGEMFDPSTLGLISEEEETDLRTSFNFLLWVRNDLHLATERKTDQLTFDQQERISGLLGFRDTERALAVESFMQTYYRHAKDIARYSDLILSRCLLWEEERDTSKPAETVDVDPRYEISDGVLTLKHLDAFSADPVVMIHAFELSQSRGVEIDQATKDLILNYLHKIGTGFRKNPGVAESFMRILGGRNVNRTLREMQDYGFLEEYIPEFAEITCKVQHDRYHIYTVDVHTLFAIRELDRLRDELKGEFALLSTLLEECENPEILYLAVLLHDIGKGRGKGHAEKGAEMVSHICERLGLPDDDAATVRLLVKNHLLLADTAQYRDLHDEKLIIEFARQVGDVERLNMLYLLTFADVRAVGPEVWSQWKGALFQELYFKALTILERGTFEAEEAGAKRERVKNMALEILSADRFDPEAAESCFERLPGRYFLANTPEVVAEHVKLLKELDEKPYRLTVRQDTFREYTELVVGTRDVHGLFAMIAGVMTANGVNILGAQIYTLSDGTALDILQVTSSYGGYITEASKLAKVEEDLDAVLTGRTKVEDLVGKRRKASILDTKAMPNVPTRVQIDNEVSDEYTVIDVRDENRIGLLYDITSTLSSDQNLYIKVSKITTKGDEAADIFYVHDIFGQKIFYKERLREIVDSVYEGLTEGAAAGEQ